MINTISRMNFLFITMTLLTLLILPSGCKPVRKFAMNQVAGILSSSTDTFYQDDDPELIREALPFSLKLMEGTLSETPRHRGLLLQCASSFTQYGYGFVKFDADLIEDEDYTKAQVLNQRAQKLLLRARDYSLRGLELRNPNLGLRLKKDPLGAVTLLNRSDVDLAYWLALSWGAAISVGKDNADLIADQVIVEALLDRLLELQEDYDLGSIHEAMISYEMVRQGGTGKPEERAKTHFNRAIELSGGMRAGPYVSYAEAISIQNQNRLEFEEMLTKAIAIDPDKHPASRCLNLVMQKRARWLLSRSEELFLE